MTAPGLVGANPGDLGRLARLAREDALDIRRRGALVAALLGRHGEATAAEIIRPLLAVADDMTEAAASLEWRAAAVEMAQDVAVHGCLAIHDHLADLAHFATFAVFDLAHWRYSLLKWCQPPDVSALVGISPQQVAAAFARLAPSVAASLADDYPDLVGHLDGAPPQLRYRANRILIHRRVGVLEEELRRLGQVEPPRWDDWMDPLWLLHTFPVQAKTAATVERMQRQIAEYRRWLAEDRQILLFDPRGDGRIVEVFGDLGQAGNIAVVVPGTANDKTNFSSDGGGFRANAAALFEAAAAIESGIATIAWLGYDPPDGIDAGLCNAAQIGAPALRRFLEGIDPQVHAAVSVVAHSYGSLVAGLAAANGLAADHLVFVGSPGTGLEHAADAQLRPGGRVWAGLAEADPIAAAVSPSELPPWWVPVPFMPAWLAIGRGDGAESLWHGTNPAADEFGAIRFDTDGSTGHSAYFEAGSLENLARIVLGRSGEVELAD